MAVKAAIMVPHPPIIMPEVGHGEEKKIRATTDAYMEAARFAAQADPDVIVVASPHSILYSDYFHISPGRRAAGDMRRFGAGDVRISVDYDEALAKEIAICAEREGLPAGTLGERDKSLDHGTIIPLYFLDKVMDIGRIPVVRMSLSGESLADHYRLGMCVKEASDRLGRNVLFVASGDLSHKCRAEGPYGFAPEGPEYDRRIMDVMGRGAFDELFSFDESFLDKAAECGHRSFVIMAGALDGKKVEVKKLSHEDTFGVGYGVCTYSVLGEDESREFLLRYEKEKRERMKEIYEAGDEYICLARASLEKYVKTGKMLERSEYPENLPREMLERQAGTFVSLHKDGRLRGCIGTIGPTRDCIADEIVGNAVSAAVRDPRFFPVQIPELPYLEISVDVLGDTEPIDSPEELDVKRYGVIVSSGMKRGLLLPNLDGVDTIEEQVRIAREKGGIRENDPHIRLERFEVIRHEV
ncbi:MAG: AmmeMemoRadiSam system protein A [Lachnospiraceae bacterium]|nr:AmmeMemoRadiSam system protein A [Lachnospiraceae bacterium]